MVKFLAVFSVNYMEGSLPRTGTLNIDITLKNKSRRPTLAEVRGLEAIMAERKGYPPGSVTMVNLIELAD